jgi:hypothetical protein
VVCGVEGTGRAVENNKASTSADACAMISLQLDIAGGFSRVCIAGLETGRWVGDGDEVPRPVPAMTEVGCKLSFKLHALPATNQTPQWPQWLHG